MIEISSVNIRKARYTDIKKILTILENTFKLYKKYYTEEAFTHAILLSSDEIQRRLENPKKLVLVAILKNQIIGTVTASFQEDKRIYLQSMAVLPDFQGFGIGRLLLQKIERIANEKHYKQIFFECFEPLQKSINLYKKCGYKKIENTIPFYGITLFKMKKDIEI